MGDMGGDADAAMGDEGMGDMGAEAGDEGMGDLDAAFDDAAEQNSAAGRARKESVERNVKALRESKNPDRLVYETFKRTLKEAHPPYDRRQGCRRSLLHRPERRHRHREGRQDLQGRARQHRQEQGSFAGSRRQEA